MKDLKKVKLQRIGIETELKKLLGFEEEPMYSYFVPFTKEQTAICVAMSGELEMIKISLEDNKKALNYEEVVRAKKYFWEDYEIALQVFPDNNPFGGKDIKLYRDNFVSKRTEFRIKKELKELYIAAKEYYKPNTEHAMVANEGKTLVIYGGNQWPTFEKMEELKETYWGKEHRVVQFFISEELNLNPEHIVMLWDADDFLLLF